MIRFCCIISLLLFSGCATFNTSGKAEVSFLPIPPEMPRELQKTTLPDYIIEAPDILRIEVPRVIPKSPYTLSPGDGLLVEVVGADKEYVNDVLFVELDGTLQFGSPFDDPNGETDPQLAVEGPITVSGLTVPEARKLIVEHISKTIVSPSVRVSLKEFANLQPVSGEHLVSSDGTVNLGSYGRVYVVGMTVDQARQQINEKLSEFLQNPNASVDVYAYNSKKYYIILQGAGLGDRVAQFPITGNETVLDALSNVEGLTGTTSEDIWVSRPGNNVFDGHQVLPVNWGAITQLADTSTNYQLMPGDRVFVKEDHLVAFDTKFGKIVAPLERLLGIALLGTNTVSRIEFYEQGPNGGFGNNGNTP